MIGKLEKALMTGTETRPGLPNEVIRAIIYEYSGLWTGYTKERRAEISVRRGSRSRGYSAAVGVQEEEEEE